eukprot:GHVH01010720.1.p1 GENE.GHVH01010720.1~~GHVH01010720.1.p1  ORF type:complete len:139 (+),score=21.91 GHVH01010720.1:119-535(+)
MERTFLMCKTDCVSRGLIGEMITRFENKGFKLVAMKMMKADMKILTEHYVEHKDRPFFPDLTAFMMDGYVVPMVWEGPGVVWESRRMMGATKPSEAALGTIRGDLATEVQKNLIHGSDSLESAKREISIWFKENEIMC